MTFDVTSALRKSTGRAKSDVANKLVSMFLHEVSRKACAAARMTVSDLYYAESVLAAFGKECLYCRNALESDRTTVEHLNGMNRVCVGLHIPGNVAMACKRCNNEKRRDDQNLFLARNGWESFLSHDGSRCNATCKTCVYWTQLWPDRVARKARLKEARDRVRRFQEPYSQIICWSEDVRSSLREKIEILYRDCQKFATDEIAQLTSSTALEFSDLSNFDPRR